VPCWKDAKDGAPTAWRHAAKAANLDATSFGAIVKWWRNLTTDKPWIGDGLLSPSHSIAVTYTPITKSLLSTKFLPNESVPIVTLETSGADSSSPHGGSAGDFSSNEVRLLGRARGCVGGVIGFCSLPARGNVVARFFRRRSPRYQDRRSVRSFVLPTLLRPQSVFIKCAMLTGRKGRAPRVW
jgi:hypothetical protein